VITLPRAASPCLGCLARTSHLRRFLDALLLFLTFSLPFFRLSLHRSRRRRRLSCLRILFVAVLVIAFLLLPFFFSSLGGSKEIALTARGTSSRHGPVIVCHHPPRQNSRRQYPSTASQHRGGTSTFTVGASPPPRAWQSDKADCYMRQHPCPSGWACTSSADPVLPQKIFLAFH